MPGTMPEHRRRPGLSLRLALLLSAVFAAIGLLLHAAVVSTVDRRERSAAEFHAAFIVTDVLVPVGGSVDGVLLGLDTLVRPPVVGVTLWRDGERLAASGAPVAMRPPLTDAGVVSTTIDEILSTTVPISIDGGDLVAVVDQDQAASRAAAGQLARRLDTILVGGLLALFAATLPIARRAARSIERRERRFRSLVQGSSDPLLVLDAHGVVIDASPAAGRALAESAGRQVSDLVEPADRAMLRSAIGACIEDGTASTRDLRWPTADGEVRVFESRLTNLLDEPSVGGIVVNSRDVTERVQLERELSHRAFHDTLTGLPNRALFTDRLEHRLRRQTDARPAVLFVDVDNFKPINDTFGHDAGDDALREVGQRLRAAVGPADTVARVGGDEFAILLDGVGGGSDALTTASRIVHAVGGPMCLRGGSVPIGVSVGAAVAIGDRDARELLRESDLAMYQAKLRGRRRAALFAPWMDGVGPDDLALEADLDGAAQRGELYCDYQPIVEVASRQVVGAEALVRWRHPQLGVVAPGHFIPIAERTGAVREIGELVLTTALGQLARWQRETFLPAGFKVSVNLSATQLGDDLVDRVVHALDEHGIDPGQLVIEITETAMIRDHRVAQRLLATLRTRGVKVAVDDFGTGYSSMAYLHSFPCDALKLDRSFTETLTTSPSAGVLVGHVVQLARDLGMRSVAEGVETDEQHDALLALGCELGQGYLYGRPTTPEAILERLRSEQAAGWNSEARAPVPT